MTQNHDHPQQEQVHTGPVDEEGMSRAPGDRPVPGVGGAPESSADGQQGLRLHAGIAAVATALSVLVVVVFVRSGVWPLAVAFALVALATLGVLAWALRHKQRGARLRASRAGAGRPTAPEQGSGGRAG